MATVTDVEYEKEMSKANDMAAIQAQRVQIAGAWTQQQAAEHAKADLEEHDLLGKEVDQYRAERLRDDMGVNVGANQHYREAIEKTSPALLQQILAEQAQALEERKRREAMQANTAMQAENAVSVERKGKELERDEFIMPRRIANNYTEVEGKFFAKGSERMMFHDQGDKLATSTSNKDAVADMVAYAKAKQWEQLKLTGSQEFRREGWLQAESQGIKTQGYTPREKDLAALKELTQERATNAITPLAERQQSKAPTQQIEAPRHDLNKNQAETAMAAEQNRTKHMTELRQKPEFERLSVDELSKIAYYRAILFEREKNAPEDLREEAIANFDNAMQDPQRVKELPETEVQIVEREKTKERSQQRETAEQSI